MRMVDKKIKIKRNIGLIFIILIMIMISGCGKSGDSEGITKPVMGRYVEEAVDILGQGDQYTELVEKDGQIYLISKDGKDLVSWDEGESYERAENVPTKVFQKQTYGSSIVDVVGTPEGERLITKYSMEKGYGYYIASADNQEIELDLSIENMLMCFYGNDGYFYTSDTNTVCQIDPKTGESRLLFELSVYILFGTGNGELLYLVGTTGVYIYDLEQKVLLEQDDTLNKILRKDSEAIDGKNPFLLYPGEESKELYILVKEGLYRHVLYEDSMEQIIDGSLCGIGDINKDFVGMADLKVAEESKFQILYSDGSLMKYVYNKQLPYVPDNLMRIFSMYEDMDVRQAVTEFQYMHPEISIKYEIGINWEDGLAVNDVLKNLSTEIAAGKGPDILLLDYLPYESYVEKGVLLDLSQALEQTGESYFENIVKPFRVGESLYTIPATFSLPLLAGEESKIKDINSLSDLADLLEKAREEKEEGYIFNVESAGDVIRVLSQASQGAWMNKDGILDKKAISDFLTQASRIYNSQMAGWENDGMIRSVRISNIPGTVSILKKRFQTDGTLLSACKADFINHPYFADYLDGTMVEFTHYLRYLEAMKMGYTAMPGQEMRSFLPSTQLSVNAASQWREEALEFVMYMISQSFQGSTYLSGLPVNVEAYYGIQQNPTPEKAYYAAMGVSNQDGGKNAIQIQWPNAKEFSKLNDLVNNATIASHCDNMIYEAVLESGEKALMGDISIEDAVDTIEKKVQLYLAE